MNHFITDDNGHSPASPHHIETKQRDVVECASCKLKYNAEDTQLSIMDGNYYCIGEYGCWNEQAQYHKEQNRLFGYPKTDFK